MNITSAAEDGLTLPTTDAKSPKPLVLQDSPEGSLGQSDFVCFKKTRGAPSQEESLRLLRGDVSRDSRVRQARDSSQEAEA